jgi:putative oxidoreductase
MNSKIALAARIILGLAFTVFGINGFFEFLPRPTDMPEAIMNFSGALMATGYFFPLLKGTEVICGLALLSNQFAALSLVILAPILINIFLVHAFLTPGLQNLVLPTVLIALALVTAYSLKEKYAALLKAK